MVTCHYFEPSRCSPQIPLFHHATWSRFPSRKRAEY